MDRVGPTAHWYATNGSRGRERNEHDNYPQLAWATPPSVIDSIYGTASTRRQRGDSGERRPSVDLMQRHTRHNDATVFGLFADEVPAMSLKTDAYHTGNDSGKMQDKGRCVRARAASSMQSTQWLSCGSVAVASQSQLRAR